MAFTLFNGSYIGSRNTGIGVVAKNLVSSLSTDLVTLLDPFNSGRPGSIEIPSDLSPENGLKGHIKRLYWVQSKTPYLIRKNKAKFFLSPLPEAPLFSSVRSIVLAHDLLPLRYINLNSLLAYYLFYVPAVLHQAELILCNSEATAREIHERIKVPVNKLVPIKLGFDRHNLYPKYLEREDFFLILGRHNPHKNLDRVLNAFSSLPSNDYRLVFVGPYDQRYTPRLKEIAKQLNISNKCVWKYWVSDAEKMILLNKCRSLIIASLWEGFGLPALEAMACGTIVIASNQGALPEVVGDVAYMVNPFNSQSIASAMFETMNDINLQTQASVNGPIQASKFNWNNTAKQIEDILLGL